MQESKPACLASFSISLITNAYLINNVAMLFQIILHAAMQCFARLYAKLCTALCKTLHASVQNIAY